MWRSFLAVVPPSMLSDGGSGRGQFHPCGVPFRAP
jgi:hypothetical protein